MTSALVTAPPEQTESRNPGAGATSVWLPGVAGIVVLGLTRLTDRELWVDEAFSAAATHDLVETVSRTHGTMSLYYALLTPWTAVSDGAGWIRLLSLVLMAVATGLLAVIVARQHGAAAGRWAGLAAACCYLPARLAVEARSYALVAVLATLSWYALDRILTEGSGRRWFRIYGACVVLLPLAHGLGAIQVIAQVLAVAWARPDRRTQARVVAAASASGLVVVGLLASGIEGVGDWLDPLSATTLSNLAAEVLHPLPVLALGVAVLVVLGQVAINRSGPAADTASTLDRFRQASLFMWGPGALALVIGLSVVRPSHLGRYSLSAAFGIAGLIGVALAHMPGPSRGYRIAAGGAVLGLLLTSHLAIDLPQPRPWTESATIVATAAQDGDGLLFTDPEVRLPFEAAWEARADRPAVELIEPGGEMGSMDRFTGGDPVAEIGADLEPGTRVFLVDQELPHATNRRPDPGDDPTFSARFDVEETWPVAPDVEVRLLVVR